MPVEVGATSMIAPTIPAAVATTMVAVIKSRWPRIAVRAVLASSMIISVSPGLTCSGASGSVLDAVPVRPQL
ncbi:MAG TPA: hypothetical protein VFP81_08655 [Propionibacteriaceae bacterium]|nr:hypothetical protein [Propionibacteriaceae bacterium]